jgi:serine protease Do
MHARLFRRLPVLLCAALLGSAAATLPFGPLAAARAQESRDPEQQARRVTPIVEVVRKVGPTVVNLYADLEVRGGFFGPQEAGSLGSGVIVHPAGLIVTNAHVITGNSTATRIKDVSVSYRADWTDSNAPMQKHKASVIGFDRTNDLALLQLRSPGPFPYARLGTSADLMIGETVVAVGNPLGREGSVTHGIVSATHRKLESPTGTEFDDLIQTDAPLNQGNSGGPLFNILGELIGINQAIAGDRQFGRAEGQGLAIPVDRVRDLLGNEFNPFDLLHLWLGFDVEDGAGGISVKRVEREGPAAKAGLAAGDRIVRVGSYDVADRTAFNLSISSLDTTRIPLTYLRDGRRREATVDAIDVDATIRDRLGASLVAQSGYLLFSRVEPRGAAASVGIAENDALIEFGGQTVDTVQAVFARLRQIDPGDEADIVLYRLRGGRPYRKLEGSIRL